jgi:hypothetical protein
MSGALERVRTDVAVPGPADVAVPDRLPTIRRREAPGAHAVGQAAGRPPGRQVSPWASAVRAGARLGDLVSSVVDRVVGAPLVPRRREADDSLSMTRDETGVTEVSEAEAPAQAGQSSQPYAEPRAPAPAIQEKAAASAPLAKPETPEVGPVQVPAIEAPAPEMVCLQPGVDYWTADADLAMAGLPEMEAGP